MVDVGYLMDDNGCSWLESCCAVIAGANDRANLLYLWNKFAQFHNHWSANGKDIFAEKPWNFHSRYWYTIHDSTFKTSLDMDDFSQDTKVMWGFLELSLSWGLIAPDVLWPTWRSQTKTRGPGLAVGCVPVNAAQPRVCVSLSLSACVSVCQSIYMHSDMYQSSKK